MPWASQASLDIFCETALWVAYVTLHTDPNPSLANQLTADLAPGYAVQPLTFSANDRVTPPRIQQASEITFGPATREWPQIQSIAIRWGAPTFPASIIATVPLAPEDHLTLPQGESYVIPAGTLYAALPTSAETAPGWRPKAVTFLDCLRDHINRASALNSHILGADLDPGGTYENAWLQQDTTLEEPAGGQALVSDICVTLYSHNPLLTPAGPGSSIRAAFSDTDPSILNGWFRGPAAGPVPFYWSPLHHGLVNFHPMRTNISASPGRATHWTASFGGLPSENDILYVGELDPPIDFAANQGAGFARRSLRLPMVL